MQSRVGQVKPTYQFRFDCSLIMSSNSRQNGHRLYPQTSSRSFSIVSAAADDDFMDPDAVPLLPQPHQNVLHRSVSMFTVSLEDDSTHVATAWKHEIGRLTTLAGPLIASGAASLAVNLIALSFFGRLGQASLASGLLAMSFFNITGLSVVIGFCGALDTLAGQAFGAKAFAQVGYVLQRSIALTGLAALLIIGFWMNIEGFIIFLGQDAAIAANAAIFLRYASPALLFATGYECLRRYLQAQGIVNPPFIVSLIGIPLAFLLNWVLVVKAGLGLKGAAMALGGVDLVLFVLLALYVYNRERRRSGTLESTWTGWSLQEMFSGWKAYLALALPSTATVALEWTAYEVCVLMAGWLASPELQLSVMGLTLNVCSFLYMFPLGLANAVSVRVSNALGAGMPKSARRSARVALAAVFTMQLLMSLVLFLGRYQLPKAFTSDLQVIASSASIMPIIAIQVLGDGLNAAFGGILRGAGRQDIGALLNLLGYWAIGLPAGAYLAFSLKMGVFGLWLGLTATAILLAVTMLALMGRFDWEAEAKKASQMAA